jgi:hypothetical protein
MTELREADSIGRITLPRGYANATLLIEVVNDVELRIRKAKVVPLSPATPTEEQFHFAEEDQLIFSDTDREAFLAALDNPPPPNAALTKLLQSSTP